MKTKQNKRSFLNDDFLLYNKTSEILYFDYAEKLPIIDYHNHLPPDQIANNHTFENISQVWLHGDHYKWRAMRALGIDESYITGNKSDVEKFKKWAETVPYTLRNPLYHWTHLELKRYFQIDNLLNEKSAEDIYHHCNEQLQYKSHSVLGLLNLANVEVVCTTDDPLDNLEHHISYNASKGSNVKMYPSFRPDKFIHIEQTSFNSSVEKLEIVSNIEITSYSLLIESLRSRALFFDSMGCRASDHGLEYISYVDYNTQEIENIYKKKLEDIELSKLEIEKYKSSILFDLSIIYFELGWVQQFHLGALRNNNTKALQRLGPDTGWDSIGDWSQARNLSAFLAKLDSNSQLTKTIIYNLNPADNEVMASMIGNFNDGSIKGKIQFGSAWWFLDQKDGMEKQLNALSNMGLISCFIGMLTDSRSFLSFPRHEYFRRILCNLFGTEIENGEMPADLPWVGKIIQDICYYNAKDYLKIN